MAEALQCRQAKSHAWVSSQMTKKGEQEKSSFEKERFGAFIQYDPFWYGYTSGRNGEKGSFLTIQLF